MLSRVCLALIAAFWATMTVLLWREEFGTHRTTGSPVPVESVWEKILTAPDNSSLQVQYHGTNIGFCRWSASVGQDASALLGSLDESLPEVMGARPTHYHLDLDGHVMPPGLPTRLGYSVMLKLGPHQAWEEFHLRVRVRPDTYEVHVRAADQTAHLRVDAGDLKLDRHFRFADLQDPQKVPGLFGGPMLPGLMAALGLPTSTNAAARLALGLKWQAHQVWLEAGHSRVRAYRLEAQLLDHYRARVFVSPVGEILKVELPGEIVLLHETLGGLPPAP